MGRSLRVALAALCACSFAVMDGGSAGATAGPTVMSFMCAYSFGAGPVYFPVSGQCAPYTTRLAVNNWQQQNSICYLTSTGAIWWTSQSGCQSSSRPGQQFVLVPALLTDEFFCASSRDGTLYYQPGGIPAAGCPVGQFAVVVPMANHPPVANPQSPSLLEDTSKLLTLTGSDQDAGQTITFKITQLPQHGKLFRGNSTAAGDEITSVPATLPAALVTYKPSADSFGPDSFAFKTNDSFVDSVPATVSLDVQAVNDAPSFTVPANANQIVAIDSGAHTVAGFASNISAGPANEAGQTLTFHVSTSNPALSSTPAINPATGDLTYTVAAGQTGTATVSVDLQDSGGTGNGGVDTSATKTFTITVVAPHFVVSAPSSATAGTPFSFTVTALNEFGNTATGYGGTVHFTSSDGQAVLPADSKLSNGVGTFAATLKTAGDQTITATDTTVATMTGSKTVTVSAGLMVSIDAPGLANFTIPGGGWHAKQDVTVFAYDAYGNVADFNTGFALNVDADVQPPPGGDCAPICAVNAAGVIFTHGIAHATVSYQAFSGGSVTIHGYLASDPSISFQRTFTMQAVTPQAGSLSIVNLADDPATDGYTVDFPNLGLVNLSPVAVITNVHVVPDTGVVTGTLDVTDLNGNTTQLSASFASPVDPTTGQLIPKPVIPDGTPLIVGECVVSDPRGVVVTINAASRSPATRKR